MTWRGRHEGELLRSDHRPIDLTAVLADLNTAACTEEGRHINGVMSWHGQTPIQIPPSKYLPLLDEFPILHQGQGERGAIWHAFRELFHQIPGCMKARVDLKAQ